MEAKSGESLLQGLTINITVNGATYYLVIDSLLRDTSSGGLRIAEDLDLAEVAALAREMTLKFSFIGLERGGAKSGLRIPKGTDTTAKKAILEAVGQRLGAIIRAGIYYPGMDMNCGPDDLRAIYRGAGFTLGELTDTSWFTAISVANAIEACVSLEPKRDSPFTIAVEGFGSVAAYLAERLPVDRFRFVAVSTIAGARKAAGGFDAATLVSSRKQWGDDFINHLADGEALEKSDLFSMEADIVVPSARTWSIDEAVAGKIAARYIVPAANAPFIGNAVEILAKRGITCLPGYVVNCGGVYASSLYDSGVQIQQIEDISSQLYRNAVVALLEVSRKNSISPVDVAESVAMCRYAAKIAETGQRALKDRVYGKARRLGLVPRRMHGEKFLASFRENLMELETQLRGWNP